MTRAITRQLIIGLAMLTAIVLFAIIGPLFVNSKMANVGATVPRGPAGRPDTGSGRTPRAATCGR